MLGQSLQTILSDYDNKGALNHLPRVIRRMGRCLNDGTYSKNLKTGLLVLPESYSDQPDHLKLK